MFCHKRRTGVPSSSFRKKEIQSILKYNFTLMSSWKVILFKSLITFKI